MTRKHYQKGFTIVELLIVIVVIAILAAITIVAYNGIQNRAKQSAAQTAVSQANKKILAFAVQNADQYPTDLSVAGITDSDTSYQYTANNMINPRTYCITATNGNFSYYMSNIISKPTVGGCAGHGQGGVAAIANLAFDPAATVFNSTVGTSGWRSSRWFGGGSPAGTYTLITDASDGPLNLKTYARKTWTGAASHNGDTGFEHNLNSGMAVTAGKTYTFSSYLRSSSQKSPARIHVSWRNTAGTEISLVNGTDIALTASVWTRISLTSTAPAGAATVVVISDIEQGGGAVWQPGDRLDGTGLMITEGSLLYPYADGDSSNWAWSGAKNASTSSGPPL